MSSGLIFQEEKYEIKTCELESREITYRAFEEIQYCENPVDPIQKLNIFVPESYYHDGQINGYSLHTAPIFMPNTVGGYMPGPADRPGRDFKGAINTVFAALEHGYVVVSAGVRGRTSGMKSQEFFVGGRLDGEESDTGRAVGKAPAFIVDMKAAIRYLRHNRERIPGDTEHIITSGTSAGGALSALTGASGNSADYEPYLEEIGAARERDDIFAANCYCPIHNLEHADMAYEWLFNGCNEFYNRAFRKIDGKVQEIVAKGTLTEKQAALSGQLKQLFPAYVNALALQDEKGDPLELDENGEGSLKEYIGRLLLASAQRGLDTHDSAGRLGMLAVKGSEVEQQDCLTIEEGKAKALNWNLFVRTVTRMKPVPAFDALNLHSPENEEFGTEAIVARHFTEFSRKNSEVNGEMAEDSIVKMLNPLTYIGKADTAKHWRIRHGAFDRDTSLAIPVILEAMLRKHGYEVDFFLPWGLPHSGDYDLDEMFAWVDELCRRNG